MKRKEKANLKATGGAKKKAVDSKAVDKAQPISDYIRQLEVADRKTFGVSEKELAKQLATIGGPGRKMKGVSEALAKNDGLLLLDGGTITGMQELGVNLHKVNELWQLQFMHNDPEPI